MEYSLLTLVENQDLAIRISDYLKSNEVYSYAAQDMEYGYGQWGVYVDESKATIAQQLLDSYVDPVSENESGYSPNWTYGNEQPQAPAYSSSTRSGSSSRWVYYFLVGLVVFGVRIFIKMNRNKTYQPVDYTSMMPKYNNYADRILSDDVKWRNDTTKSESFSNKITLEDIRAEIEASSKNLPEQIDSGLTLKRTSMKGSKILYVYTVKNGFELDESSGVPIKKEIAQNVYELLKTNKSIYGNDYFDQLADLGISFNYIYYHEGEKAPYKTVSVPASYVKKFDKS